MSGIPLIGLDPIVIDDLEVTDLTVGTETIEQINSENISCSGEIIADGGVTCDYVDVQDNITIQSGSTGPGFGDFNVEFGTGDKWFLQTNNTTPLKMTFKGADIDFGVSADNVVDWTDTTTLNLSASINIVGNQKAITCQEAEELIICDYPSDPYNAYQGLKITGGANGDIGLETYDGTIRFRDKFSSRSPIVYDANGETLDLNGYGNVKIGTGANFGSGYLEFNRLATSATLSSLSFDLVHSGVMAASSVATPAGGNASAFAIKVGSAGVGVFFGSGAPSLSAPKGSLYLRTDGSTTNDRIYVATDAVGTWTAVTTVA